MFRHQWTRLSLLQWGSILSVNTAGVSWRWALKPHKAPNHFQSLMQARGWQCPREAERPRQLCCAGEGAGPVLPGSERCPWQEAVCLRGKETRRVWRRQSHAASHCFSQLLIQERLCLLPAFLSAPLPSSLADRTQSAPPGNALGPIR